MTEWQKPPLPYGQSESVGSEGEEVTALGSETLYAKWRQSEYSGGGEYVVPDEFGLIFRIRSDYRYIDKAKRDTGDTMYYRTNGDADGPDGDGIPIDMDFGIITNIKNQLSISRKVIKFPFTSSDSAMVTDLGIEETYIITFERHSPENIDENAIMGIGRGSTAWSNGHWKRVADASLDHNQLLDNGTRLYLLPQDLRKYPSSASLLRGRMKNERDCVITDFKCTWSSGSTTTLTGSVTVKIGNAYFNEV